jgi:hypothetical protein
MKSLVQKIFLSAFVLLLGACASRTSNYGGYSPNNEMYPNYPNNGYYQGQAYPNYPNNGYPYNGNAPRGPAWGYRNNGNHRDDHHDDHHGDRSKKPWVHGGFRDDKRYYRQPARNNYQNNDRHDDHHKDDGDRSDRSNWKNDNRYRQQPQPPVYQGGGNSGYNGNIPLGRPDRPYTRPNGQEYQQPPRVVMPIQQGQTRPIPRNKNLRQDDSGNGISDYRRDRSGIAR